MRHLILIFCMTIATVLMTATATIALPACPSDQTKRYHNCFGAFTYADGDKYVGEFKNGRFHGQGTYTLADGDKYVGEFKDGKRHGQGILTFVSGSKYVGEFKDGEFHGQGTFTLADGRSYEGEFKDGQATE